jgi:hypothetical protein
MLYLNKLHHGVFNPEEVLVLVGAFDKALASLTLTSFDGSAEAMREAIAKRIVEAARQGELDQQRLAKDALDHLAMTWSRKALREGV